MYYNQRNVRNGSEFRPGQLVWLYRPARGPGITKFGHRWRGPGKIIEATGYDNYLIQMLESGQELVTHCSFLLSYYYPTHLLEQMGKDIAADLREEAVAAADLDSDDEDDTVAEMEAPSDDQNSPETVGAAVVTSAATEPSRAETPRVATPARAEIAAAADEAAAAAPTEQPEADLTPRPDVQQPARRLSPARKQRRRAERPEPAAAAADQDQGRDAVPDRPRVRTKRPRAAPASSAIAGRTRAKIRKAPNAGVGRDDGRDESPSRAHAGPTALAAADQPSDEGQSAGRVAVERDGEEDQGGGGQRREQLVDEQLARGPRVEEDQEEGPRVGEHGAEGRQVEQDAATARHEAAAAA
ncbi:hypothetical protein PF003_g26007 [Phytophthora fragariae]|nr:hypothetical protein PF003_g26007 [Phytophthora fragariae]